MTFTQDQLLQLQQVMAAAMQPLQAQIVELQSELADVKHQLQHGDERMDSLAAGIKQNNESTADMRDMFDTAQKGLRVLGTLGAGLKWVAGIALAVSSLYAALKGHKP